jgi:hypothetical protein
MKAKTKEEKFLVAACEAALKAGNWDLELNRFRVGETIGMKEHAINIACNQLAQANFVKKLDLVHFTITENGRQLFTNLLGSPKVSSKESTEHPGSKRNW